MVGSFINPRAATLHGSDRAPAEQVDMLRILDRLNLYLTWQLLSPRSNLPAGIAVRSCPDHAHRLAALQAARARAFGVDDRALNAGQRSADARASHFVALDRRGEVAGAMRLFVVHRQAERLSASMLAGFGHVSFATPQIECRQLGALDRWLKSNAHDQVFVYAGGFFTGDRWRGSGLAAVLGMAAIAMARLHDSRASASFASTQGQAPVLFSLLGAKPLEVAPGIELEPFDLPHYDIPVRLMTFDSLQPDPSIETGVLAVMRQMLGLTALTAREDGPSRPHGLQDAIGGRDQQVFS
jgi:hypothetical protein